MARKPYHLIAALGLLSLLSGYLLAHASWLGRTGIKLMYKEYGFLNSWWQAAIAVFVVWMLFYALQSLAKKKLAATGNLAVQISCLLVAGIGLFFSYKDFRETLSHRWMGERFHLGVYLFWIGWMIVSVCLLTGKQPGMPKHEDKTEPSAG